MIVFYSNPFGRGKDKKIDSFIGCPFNMNIYKELLI
jgi:hypothetical protein